MRQDDKGKTWTFHVIRAENKWWKQGWNPTDWWKREQPLNSEYTSWTAATTCYTNYNFGKDDFKKKKGGCPYLPTYHGSGNVTYDHVLLAPLGKSKTKNLHGTAPVCALKVVVGMSQCSTCCCKGGYIKQPMQAKLVTDNSPDCSLWFSGYVDSLLRFGLNTLRAQTVTQFIVKPCLEKKWCLKTPREDQRPQDQQRCDKLLGKHYNLREVEEELGEGVGGRRGGGLGAASSFSLGGGSNRAGNDESLL